MMQKWKYRVIRFVGSPEDLEEALDKLGKDGWEVATGTKVADVGVQVILKRPVVTRRKAQGEE